MTEARIQTFADFWPYYVGEHRSPFCRGLHYLGTSLGVAFLLGAAATRNPWLILAGFLCGYAFAWVGHFFVENNRPATFKYPGYSLMADFVMLGYAVRGKMADEVTRLYGSPSPAADAPLRARR